VAYIFIDESGQFGKHDHEEHFVVASFTIGNPSRTAKAFRSWQGSRFPKKMRWLNEIKWSSTSIDDNLRLRTLRHIAQMDVRIRYVFLQKKNIPESYKNGDERKLESGLLYTNIIGETIEMYLPTEERNLHVICDQRKLKGFTQMQFKNALRSRLLPKLPSNATIEIEMVDSVANVNIQIVDRIVGALGRYHEKKPLGEECFAILKNNLLDSGKELFRD
jgi:hypothetical protein